MGIVIELLGISRSGKTTQLRLLAYELNKAGHTYTVVDRPSISYRENQNLEEWHLFYYQYLCEAQDRFLRIKTDYLIYDRGFCDRLALLTADYEAGFLKKTFFDLLVGSIKSNLNLIDFAFLFMLSPEQSLARMSRQHAQKLDKSSLSKGLTTRDNKKGLEFMMKIYQSLALENPNKKWYIVDGIISIKKTHAMIKKILDLNM